jgi:hypothetical protein
MMRRNRNEQNTPVSIASCAPNPWRYALRCGETWMQPAHLSDKGPSRAVDAYGQVLAQTDFSGRRTRLWWPKFRCGT